MSKLVATHGRDHRTGGPDEIPSTGGLAFDTYPQSGDWFYARTTGQSGVGLFSDAGLIFGVEGGSGFHALQGTQDVDGCEFYMEPDQMLMNSWSSAHGSVATTFAFTADTMELYYVGNPGDGGEFTFRMSMADYPGGAHLLIDCTEASIEASYIPANPEAVFGFTAKNRDVVFDLNTAEGSLHVSFGQFSPPTLSLFSVAANDSSRTYLAIEDNGGTISYHIPTGTSW